jgi:hypothetical protein
MTGTLQIGNVWIERGAAFCQSAFKKPPNPSPFLKYWSYVNEIEINALKSLEGLWYRSHMFAVRHPNDASADYARA